MVRTENEAAIWGLFYDAVQHHRPAGDLAAASLDRRGFTVGVQLVADYGREDLLVRVAARLEQALPWSHRRPPIVTIRE